MTLLNYKYSSLCKSSFDYRVFFNDIPFIRKRVLLAYFDVQFDTCIWYTANLIDVLIYIFNFLVVAALVRFIAVQFKWIEITRC